MGGMHLFLPQGKVMVIAYIAYMHIYAYIYVYITRFGKVCQGPCPSPCAAQVGGWGAARLGWKLSGARRSFPPGDAAWGWRCDSGRAGAPCRTELFPV